MKLPTLKACIQAIGQTEGWKGNCYGIASLLVEKKLVTGGKAGKATAVYGHWLGPVAETSFFKERRGSLFIQHGWILMPDTSIVDPTRWVFEDVKPYLFHGENLGLYDEGGNKFRMAVLGAPPDFDPSDKQFEITKGVMDSATWNFVEKILELDYSGFYEEDGEGQEPGVLTRSQLHWIANLPPSTLGKHQAGVYQALEKLDRSGLIPIDNYRAYERTLPKRRKTGAG